MTGYRCRVSDASGKISEIERQSPNTESLLRELTSEGLYLISARPHVKDRSTFARKFPRQTVIEFTDTLAIMIDSGLSLRDALEVSRSIFTKGKAKDLIELITSKIRKGNTFSSVVAELSTSFPPIYRALIRIGERIGSLEAILKELSRYLNDDKKLKEKIFGSLLYPALVLAVSVVGIVTILVVVFPRIRTMLQSLSQTSPQKIDALLRSVTTAFAAGAVVIGLIVVAVALVFIIRKAGGALARRLDGLLLKAPLIGPALLRTHFFLFSFAMEILTSNGVPVEEALGESASLLTNRALREAVLEAKGQVERGVRLSDAFLAHPQFPERIGRWIGIGERIGSTEKVFLQLKGFYQAELERWTTRVMSLIEPALIIVVGALMLYLVFTFIIPIFSLFSNLV